MAIVQYEVLLSYMECDLCDLSFEKEGELVGYNSDETLMEECKKAGWVIKDGKWICPACKSRK